MLETLELKPKLNSKELIELLKSKNIKFNIISESDAIIYLNEKNNYYNITSYKNNFLKYPSPAGKYEGMYLNLDFAYLIDLANVDYMVRRILYYVISSTEHYLKIRILKLIDIVGDNGYTLVNLYLEKDFGGERKVHNSILSKVGDEYYKKIFSKYDIDKDTKLKNIPIWEFIEIISFGELIKLYEFLCDIYKLNKEKPYVFILRQVRKLRNAVYHNTNILVDLGIKNCHYPNQKEINDF